MATIGKRRRIPFVAGDGSRKTVRLGKIRKQSESFSTDR
jgi:hypothetical protein